MIADWHIGNPEMSSRTVSVYVPTRDRLGLLTRAVESILAQTHREIELIVIDDGSQDGTQVALQTLASRDSRLRAVSCDVSSGACAARNRGLALATGRWITGCDDDDYFEPRRIEELVAAWDDLERRNLPCSALYTEFCIEDKGRQSYPNLPDLVDAAAIKTQNVVGNQVFTLTATMRRAGGFDTRLPAWQDFDLWVRLIASAGPMRKAGSRSYVMDCSHELPRISAGAADRLKAAFELFLAKHGQSYTERERALLYLNYLAYEQVPIGLWELLRGFRAGEFRAYAGALLAKLRKSRLTHD